MSQDSDAPSTGGTKMVTSTGAAFLVRSELMQNYATGQALPTSDAQLASALDGAGEIQLFSIGDQGKVFNLFPTDKVETGWGVRPMNAPGPITHLTAGTELSGAVVVLACGSDGEIYWISDEPFCTWIELGRPFGVGTVQALRTGYGADGEVMFQAITTMPDQTQGVIRIYPRRADLPWDYVSNFITGRIYDCVAGASPDGEGASVSSSDELKNNTNVTFYRDHQIAGRTCYAASIDDMVAMAGTVDTEGLTQVFVLSEQAQAYYLDPMAPSDGSLVALGTSFAGNAVSFSAIGASLLGTGDGGRARALQFFGISTGGSLYVCNQQLPDTEDKGTAPWSSLISLGDGFQSTPGSFTLCRDDQGITHCFIATGDGQLLDIRQDATTDWQTTPIAIPYEGDVADFPSYSTQITLLDASGSPVPASSLVVSAADYLQVSVNGLPGSIGPDRSMTGLTDGAGRITVTTPTSDLGVTCFQIQSPILSDGVLTIAPDRYIQDYLYDQGPDGLAQTLQTKSITTTDGTTEPLVDPAYAQYLPDVSAAVCQSLSLAMPVEGDGEATTMLVSRRGDVRGVQVMARGQHGGRIDTSRVPDQFWRIEFLERGVRFHLLRDEAHYQEVALELGARAQPSPDKQVSRSSRSSGSQKSSRPTWGNLFHSIKHGAAEVRDVLVHVVSTVETETQQVVRRIEMGIQVVVQTLLQPIANFVVDTIKQVFDVVQSVFEAIEVGIDKLLCWVGSIFDWSAILTTHTAIAQVLGDFLNNQLPTTIDEIKSVVDGFFENLTTSGVNTGSTGNDTLGSGYSNAMSQAGQAPGPSSNWMQTQMLNSDGGAPAGVPAVDSAKSADPLTTFEQKVKTELGGLVDSLVAELSTALAQGKSAEQITPNAIVALVARMIEQGVLTAVQAVADVAFDLADFVVQCVAQVAASPWHIPVISKLYKKMIGSEMTLLDLAALALAVPTSVAIRAAGLDVSGIQLVARNARALQMVLTPAQRMGRAPVDEATRTRLRAVGFDDSTSGLAIASQVLGIVYSIGQVIYSPFAWMYAVDRIKGKWLEAIPVVLAVVPMCFSFPLWNGWPTNASEWITLGCWSVGFLLWFGCSALPSVSAFIPRDPVNPSTQPLLTGNVAETTPVLDLVTGTFGFAGGCLLLLGYVVQGGVEAFSDDYLPGSSTAARVADVGMKGLQDLLSVLPTVTMPLKWAFFTPYFGRQIYGGLTVLGTAGPGAVALVRDGINIYEKRTNHII